MVDAEDSKSFVEKRGGSSPSTPTKIALIGMPTSGKSTISKMFSEHHSCLMIDVDAMMEERFGCSLQDYIIKFGESQFIEQENDILLSICYPDNCVISTGGSVVYATTAMLALKQTNVIFIYLEVPLVDLESRLAGQQNSRGIVMNGSKTWKDLLDDRHRLYVQYADIVIDTSGKTPEVILEEINARLAQW